MSNKAYKSLGKLKLKSGFDERDQLKRRNVIKKKMRNEKLRKFSKNDGKGGKGYSVDEEC